MSAVNRGISVGIIAMTLLVGVPVSMIRAAQATPTIRFLMNGDDVNYSEAANRIAFERFDPAVIGGPALNGKNDQTGTMQLWTAAPDDSDEKCLSCQDIPNGPRHNQHVGVPTWHASGKWLVVAVEMPVHGSPHASALGGSGAYNDMWAVSVDGGQWVQLTHYSNHETSSNFSDTPAGALIPKFSRNGDTLVWAEMIGYDSAHPLGIWRLVTADFKLDASGPHLANLRRATPGLPGATFYEAWSFSADDSQLTVASDSGKPSPFFMDVQIWNPSKNTLTNLTNDPFNYNEQAFFSPDDSHIAYMSTHGVQPAFDPHQFFATFRTEVWMMNRDGSQPTQITNFNDPSAAEYLAGITYAIPTAWGPGGKNLYVDAHKMIDGKEEPHERSRIYLVVQS